MTGVENVSYRNGGLVHPPSWINCSETTRSGLIFINSSDIHISNFGFDSCGAKAVLECKFLVHIALALDRVINLTLHGVVINNTKGFGLHCDNVFGRRKRFSLYKINAKGDSRVRVYGGNASFWFGASTLHQTW